MRSHRHRIFYIADHEKTAEMMTARRGRSGSEVVLADPVADGFDLAKS